MANTKTSDESAASALTGSELVRIVQSGSSVRTTTQDIADLGGGGWGHTLVTSTSATLADSNRIVDVDCTAVSAPGTVPLTLPTASAGRVYLIRKIAGAADETITLDRSGSVEIDYAAADRVLPGSNEPVGTDGFYMWPMWLVWSDGTDWHTRAVGNQVLNTKSSAAPTGDEPDGYMPGSTWCEAIQDPGSKMHMQMGADAGASDWMRIDAVDVVEIDSGDSPYTMPTRDRSIFVDTSSGAVTLSHPGAGGQVSGVQFSITKVNTGTSKITLSWGASVTVNGSSVSSYDLPGSDDADYGRWHVVSASNKIWVTGGSGLT